MEREEPEMIIIMTPAAESVTMAIRDSSCPQTTIARFCENESLFYVSKSFSTKEQWSSLLPPQDARILRK